MKIKLLLSLALIQFVHLVNAEDGFQEIPQAPINQKEIRQILGVSTWSATLSVPAGENRQAMIYFKEKGKPPTLLAEGQVIRNDKGKNSVSRRVIVAIDGLQTRPWQPKLKIGIGVSIESMLMPDTVIADNPFPKNTFVTPEQLGLMRDKQGRMMLAQGNADGMTAFPGVDGQDFAVYLVLDDWKVNTK